MRRLPRMSRLATLCAALMLSTVLFAVPALAATSSVSWDYSTGQDLLLDVPVEAGTISLGEAAGAECTADVEVRNGTSTHPNNDLVVDLNGGTIITIEDFEATPGTTLTGSAAFVATGSDELVVSIVFTNPARPSSKTSSEGTLTVTCEPPPPGGGEGCTPGYWKQDHHFDSWDATGLLPGDDYDTVFGLAADTTEWTLLDALEAKGGQENALGRHATAALLNSLNPDVSYEYSSLEVIALVQGAYASGDYNGVKDLLEYQNELGCPLN